MYKRVCKLTYILFSTGGSRQSAKGINADNRQGGANLMFPSISRIVFFNGGEEKSIAKLNGGHGRTSPLDPPLFLPVRKLQLKNK